MNDNEAEFLIYSNLGICCIATYIYKRECILYAYQGLSDCLLRTQELFHTIRVTECHLKNVIGRSGSIGSLLVGLKEIESKPSTVNHSCSPLQAREGRQDIGIVSKGPRREGRERFCLCLCVRQKIMRFWLENRFYSTPEINVGCKTPVLENQKAVMFGLKNFSRLIHRRHILSMASTEK